MKRHRNSQKRLRVDEGVFFITSVTGNRYPYFREQVFCEVFVDQLRLAKSVRDFRLYGFVIMPDHVPLLIHPGKEETISGVMHFLKRNTSRNLNRVMGYERFTEGEDDHPRLHQNLPRLQYVHKQKFEKFEKFEFSIFNHENELRSFRSKWIKKHGSSFPHPKFAWQSSFHDHLIRNERDFVHHLSYIWTNPEEHGLAPDNTTYPYSSYSRYHYLLDFS